VGLECSSLVYAYGHQKSKGSTFMEGYHRLVQVWLSLSQKRRCGIVAGFYFKSTISIKTSKQFSF